ncbi:hypothetical protein Bca4012_062241 [Brassica carinata]
MSSSSSSSRSNSARQTTGIPTRCWCGADLTTFGAQTKDNLFRRFYRCEIGLKHPAINIAIAALALGTMAWLYGKFSN